MADKSISDLPKAAALYDTDRMVLEQNGEAKHMEGRLLKDYVEPYASAAQSALEGVKEAIDNIPEGTATPIVNDLTTGGTSMALSAEMGKKLKNELDGLTPEDIGALPLDGSKAMTGKLSVNNGQGVVKAGNGSAQLEHYPTAGDATVNIILGIRAKDTLDKIARLYHTVDNATTAYNILHTGNKPSGSYTGNGSTAARTIETGGIGNVCVIYGGQGVTVVTRNGGICGGGETTTPKTFKSSEIQFSNGVLSIKTASASVNLSGDWYDYQVL